MSDRTLCVDLGGTNMRAAVVDAEGGILLSASEATPLDADRTDGLKRLMESMRDYGGGSGAFQSIVVGVPGRVDYRQGSLEYAPNLPASWLPELTESRLSNHFDAPVHLANDADLAAVGEAYFGAGRPYTDVVYVTISTGVGAGVVLDGKLLRAKRSLAEIGHTIVSVDQLTVEGPATVEQLGAGPALSRNALAVGVDADGAELVNLVADGDTVARKAWDKAMLAAGAGVVSLAHLFSPEVIVVGGGVGRNGALVQEPLTAMLSAHGPQKLKSPITVAEAELGDDSGIVGGAAWSLATGA